ncbi:glycosyltransferase [Pseudonocardia halophobica]|uniref:glycosyltransferase n=1 Tax=Pseudonocardia halophobica TaxID=29401 RepID=UPI000A8CCC17|nr:glycosyltransferase [Pseudonocardia halophobica]
MRILVASWPGFGHLLPMVPLIRAAQRAGAEVVVSTGADLAPTAARLGVRVHRSGATLAASFARLNGVTSGGLPPDERPLVAARHFFGAGAVERARDVAALLDDWRPDLVVHDTLELGSATAAVAHGVPHVTHGYGPTVPDTARFGHVIGETIGAAGLPDPITAVFAAPYLDPCPPGLRGPEPHPWTDLRPVRPTAGEVGEPDPDLAAALDALPHEDTVYVTLGTVTNRAPEIFRAVLEGCVRRGVNVVVTTGPDVDPAGLGPQPPGVLAARYLPQAQVLPRCRAVVSHAGAGTMIGAVCHGLPQLCLPQGTDQPSNTAALVPTGAGLALEPGEVTPDAVATALGRLLGEPSFRRAAQRLAAEVAAMPVADEVLAEVVYEVAGAAS